MNVRLGVRYEHFRTIFSNEQRYYKQTLKITTCPTADITVIFLPTWSHVHLHVNIVHSPTVAPNMVERPVTILPTHTSVRAKAYFPGFLTLFIRIW